MDVELANGRIHSVEHGTGTPILIMHGGGLDHRHMEDAFEPVFKGTEGWKRVYIDLPGHGASLVNDCVVSQDDVFGLISDFATHAFGGRPFAVIGESRGSYHAMALAHTRPQDMLGMMLVVADGMPGATVDWRPDHTTLVRIPETKLNSASPEARTRFSRLVVQSSDILEKIERTKVAASKLADQGLAERLKSNFNFSFDVFEKERIFEQPCLVLNGRQDAMAGYQDMMDCLEKYPRATFAALDCAGHSLAWEQPELLKSLTSNWLQRMKLHL